MVDIRAASRSTPDLLDGKLQLSLSDGLTYDRNSAKRLMVRLSYQDKMIYVYNYRNDLY